MARNLLCLHEPKMVYMPGYINFVRNIHTRQQISRYFWPQDGTVSFRHTCISSRTSIKICFWVQEHATCGLHLKEVEYFLWNVEIYRDPDIEFLKSIPSSNLQSQRTRPHSRLTTSITWIEVIIDIWSYHFNNWVTRIICPLALLRSFCSCQPCIINTAYSRGIYCA